MNSLEARRSPRMKQPSMCLYRIVWNFRGRNFQSFMAIRGSFSTKFGGVASFGSLSELNFHQFTEVFSHKGFPSYSSEHNGLCSIPFRYKIVCMYVTVQVVWCDDFSTCRGEPEQQGGCSRAQWTQWVSEGAGGRGNSGSYRDGRTDPVLDQMVSSEYIVGHREMDIDTWTINDKNVRSA